MSFPQSRVADFVITLQNELGVKMDINPAPYPIQLIQSSDGRLNIAFYPLPDDREIAVGGEPKVRERFQLEGASSLIHIDEDQWRNQPDLIVSRLKMRMGLTRKIHARKTVVARIDKAQAMQFQQDHHMQVALPGKYRYGLFFQGELVSVAIFSGGRRMQQRPEDYRSFELLRFCPKKDTQIVGGLSKLIRVFAHDFHPGDLMTYADRDWSDGHRFEKIGFEIREHTAPQTFWIDCRTMHRYTEYDLPEPYRLLSDAERCERGFCKIANSGSLKLVKTDIFPKLG